MNELTARQEKIMQKCPPTMKNALARAYSGTSSPRGAIRAKCFDCSNFERQEAVSCTVQICPLWRFRPGQPTGRAKRATQVQTNGRQSG